MVPCLMIILKYRGNKLYLYTSFHSTTLFNATYSVVTIIMSFFKLVPRAVFGKLRLVCLLAVCINVIYKKTKP